MRVSHTEVLVHYNPSVQVSYSILIGNDLWGCGDTITAPAGYAGDIRDKGWDRLSFIEHMKDNKKVYGNKIAGWYVLPDDIRSWIRLLVAQEEQSKIEIDGNRTTTGDRRHTQESIQDNRSLCTPESTG